MPKPLTRGRALGSSDQGHQQDLPGDEIYQRIRESVLRNQIGPGTKLAEVKLCELFKTNREVVRRALIRLASDGIVEYYPKRGAFVASPSEAQVEQVRDARIAIESELTARLAGRIDEASLAELDRIATAQIAHRQAGDLDAAVALSSTFHITLAEIDGNPFCIKYLVELTAITCLAIAKFAVPANEGCPIDEHVSITTALRSQDGSQAADLMRAHLGSVHNAILHCAHRPAPSLGLNSLINNSGGTGWPHSAQDAS